MRTHPFVSLLPVLIAVFAGLALGAYFGMPFVGLSVAIAGALVFHWRRLFQLERALLGKQQVDVPEGDGIWSRVLAGIRHEQQRVRKHKGRHRRLMKELRQSTNALPDGVVALTSDNEIIRYNPAARDLIGLRNRKDRGQRIDNLIRHPEFVGFLQGGDFSTSLVIPSKVREDGWLNLTLVPYSEGNRLLVVRDVTERTRLNRVRRDFVANASHELRTPLTVISGYIDAMLGDPEMDAVWQKPLDEMNRQAERMRTMLDELLALSKLEVNGQAPTNKPIDIGVVLRDVVAPYQDESHDVRIVVESSRRVLGEYSDLASVAVNLLTNAIRYSAEGCRITLTWYDRGDQSILSVEDEGDGIAAEDIPRLTERFFRVDRGRERASGGVGLGLAIVKYALARHDATLEIESELGVGSTFAGAFPANRLIPGESASVREFLSA